MKISVELEARDLAESKHTFFLIDLWKTNKLEFLKLHLFGNY